MRKTCVIQIIHIPPGIHDLDRAGRAHIKSENVSTPNDLDHDFHHQPPRTRRNGWAERAVGDGFGSSIKATHACTHAIMPSHTAMAHWKPMHVPSGNETSF